MLVFPFCLSFAISSSNTLRCRLQLLVGGIASRQQSHVAAVALLRAVALGSDLGERFSLPHPRREPLQSRSRLSALRRRRARSGGREDAPYPHAFRLCQLRLMCLVPGPLLWLGR